MELMLILIPVFLFAGAAVNGGIAIARLYGKSIPDSLVSLVGAAIGPQRLQLPAGCTLGDLLLDLGIPAANVHLAFVNGRDVTPRLHGGIETDHALQDGDVVALSGPVPYSWGYGSPVV